MFLQFLVKQAVEMSFITLHNQNIDPVIWQDGRLCLFIINSQVDIWQIDVNSQLPNLKKQKEILHPDEIMRANKYLRDADRNRFIVSRSTLRNILGKYTGQEPTAIEFKLGNTRKPYIDFPLHFNLSDSGDRVIIAIAGYEVGVDVEFIKPDFSYDSIISSHFNAQEIEYIKETDSANRFFKLWTRKEAILKATGIGLTEDLVSITSLDGMNRMDGELLSTKSDWLLNTLMPDENYLVTIASNPVIEKYYFYNYQL